MTREGNGHTNERHTGPPFESDVDLQLLVCRGALTLAVNGDSEPGHDPVLLLHPGATAHISAIADSEILVVCMPAPLDGIPVRPGAAVHIDAGRYTDGVRALLSGLLGHSASTHVDPLVERVLRSIIGVIALRGAEDGVGRTHTVAPSS